MSENFQYKVSLTPRDHQVAGAKMIYENFKKNRGCALFFEPGTGKTLAAFMGALAYTKNHIKHGKTLVVTLPFLTEDFEYKIREYCSKIKVAVVKSTINQEKVHFVKSSLEDCYTPREPELLTLDPRKATIFRDGKDFKLLVKKNSLDMPLKFKGDNISDSDFMIISYNLLSEKIPALDGLPFKTDRATGRKYTYVGAALKHIFNYDCIIFDESQKIKDGESKATKTSLFISKDVPSVVMTGTPVGNGLWDLWSQYTVSKIDGVVNDHKKFMYSHFIFGGYKNRQVLGPKKDGEAKIKSYGKGSQVMTVLTKDVTSIPEEITEIHTFELSLKYKALYDRYESEMGLELKGYKDIEEKTELSMKLHLQSFTSGLIPQEGDYDFDNKKLAKTTFVQVNNEKLEVLRKLIDARPDKRMIIWYRFTESRVSISKMLESMEIKFESLYGQMNETVTEKVSRWRLNTEYKVLLAQVSINAGYDANEAKTNIYYESTFSFLDDKQSRGRTQRIGQKDVVEYIYIVASGTIDEKIQKKLDKKRKTSHDLFEAHRSSDDFKLSDIFGGELKIKKKKGSD